MSFSVARPVVLYLLVLIIPFVIHAVYRYRHLVNTMISSRVVLVKRKFAARIIFISLSFAMLIVACAGVSWGTVAVPVQKNGNALSLVFDISYSMNADDAPGRMTRLESAKSYASELLDRMPGTSVSVVIAKGDGAVVVPLTDDRETVQGMLRVLSPSMMTSVGPSLGAGIEAAIASFPQQSAVAGRIWLFTDGDETDSSLVPALNDAVRYGIPVAIIGFGSERETEVIAGDGTTRVRTALRSQSLEKTVAAVQRKNMLDSSSSLPSVIYIDASQVGSAYALLSTLPDKTAQEEGGTNVAYEVQSVDRNSLFILLAIVFFIMSYAFSEFTYPGKKAKAVAAVSLVLLLSSCSERFDAGTKLLEGSIQWNRKNYQQAVAHYLEVGDIATETNDTELTDYALFGLATTYMMQDESEAALRRFNAISQDAPDSIKFAVLYNSGIVAHQNGDYQRAASYFRDALRIDSSSIDAKINLELSLRQSVSQSNAAESELTPVSTNTDSDVLEQALYSIIRENEQKQWKSQQQSPSTTAADY